MPKTTQKPKAQKPKCNWPKKEKQPESEQAVPAATPFTCTIGHSPEKATANLTEVAASLKIAGEQILKAHLVCQEVTLHLKNLKNQNVDLESEMDKMPAYEQELLAVDVMIGTMKEDITRLFNARHRLVALAQVYDTLNLKPQAERDYHLYMMALVHAFETPNV